MIQAFIAGLLGLVLGFGAGQLTGDGEFAPREQNRMQNQEQQTMQEQLDTPLAADYLSVRPEIQALAAGELSTEEVEGLLFMREEEKLARDVYMTLYDQWGMQIFANIAQSEQTHTEAVRQLLDKYDLADPVTDDTVGVFVNEDLQALYDQLVADGRESLVAALTVGAMIEDLDIKDLEEQMELTDNADIELVYSNLQRGSRNHLRSFVSQLERQAATYEPQYISAEEYKSIISSDREAGTGTSRGWGGGAQGGHGNGGGRGGN